MFLGLLEEESGHLIVGCIEQFRAFENIKLHAPALGYERGCRRWSPPVAMAPDLLFSGRLRLWRRRGMRAAQYRPLILCLDRVYQTYRKENYRKEDYKKDKS